MKVQKKQHRRALRRMKRVRKKVSGTPDRPRLAVSRSLKNISAQLIDDMAGKTLLTVSTLSADLKGKSGGNVAAAKEVGKLVGEKAQGLGIQVVSFDRRGRRFHGRVKAVAEAAREAGLKF